MAAKPEDKCSSERRTLILGLGNILLKDEGVGVRVIEQLQEQTLPDNVEVVDGGTACMDVLLTANGIERLIVIDAMRAGRKPGTVYKARFKAHQRRQLEQIFSRGGSNISLHQMGLVEALAVAEKINCAPDEIVIIGVEPNQTDCGLELTEEVKSKLSEIVNTVLEEIGNDIYTG